MKNIKQYSLRGCLLKVSIYLKAFNHFKLVYCYNVYIYYYVPSYGKKKEQFQKCFVISLFCEANILIFINKKTNATKCGSEQNNINYFLWRKHVKGFELRLLMNRTSKVIYLLFHRFFWLRIKTIATNTPEFFIQIHFESWKTYMVTYIMESNFSVLVVF